MDGVVKNVAWQIYLSTATEDCHLSALLGAELGFVVNL